MLISGGKVKRLIILTILLVIIWGLASTNPGIDKYVQWGMVQLNQHLQKETTGPSDPWGQLKQTIIKWGVNKYGPEYIRANTRVDNYLVATLYTTEFNGEKIKVLGILNHFLPLSRQKL